MYENHKWMLNCIFNKAEGEHGYDEINISLNDNENKEELEKSYTLICYIYKNIDQEKMNIFVKEILLPLENIDIDFNESLNIIESKARALWNKYNSSNHLSQWYLIMEKLLTLKTMILNILEKNYFEIKIEINENENPKLKNVFENYKVVQDLFTKGEYEKALDHARNTFQKDLKENFDANIKIFEMAKEGTIEFHFNQILQNISDIRNKHFKVTNKSKNSEIRALAKISIEQLINIRNFIEISKW